MGEGEERKKRRAIIANVDGGHGGRTRARRRRRTEVHRGMRVSDVEMQSSARQTADVAWQMDR